MDKSIQLDHFHIVTELKSFAKHIQSIPPWALVEVDDSEVLWGGFFEETSLDEGGEDDVGHGVVLGDSSDTGEE